MLKNLLKAGAPILASTLLVTAPAHAQSAAEFYKGKNIEIFVGAGAGGGGGRGAGWLAERRQLPLRGRCRADRTA